MKVLEFELYINLVMRPFYGVKCRIITLGTYNIKKLAQLKPSKRLINTLGETFIDLKLFFLAS